MQPMNTEDISDVALPVPNFASLESMIQMCESFAQRFDLLFNAITTVCILFSYPCTPWQWPSPLCMNIILSRGTEHVKHLYSIWRTAISKKTMQSIRNALFLSFVRTACRHNCVFKSHSCTYTYHLFGSQARIHKASKASMRLGKVIRN